MFGSNGNEGCQLPAPWRIPPWRVGGKSGAANNNPLSSQSQVIKTSATRPTLRTLQISFVNNWFQILKIYFQIRAGLHHLGLYLSVSVFFFRERSPGVLFFFFRSLDANYTLPAARASLSKGSHVYTCLIVVAEQRGGRRIPWPTHLPSSSPSLRPCCLISPNKSHTVKHPRH